MLPTTRFRSVIHPLGIHHYTPWVLGVATYEAGPLLRVFLKDAPKTWREDVQVRRCRICNLQKIRRLDG